jgi:hypothetical protein
VNTNQPFSAKSFMQNVLVVIAFVIITSIAQQYEPLVRLSQQLQEQPQPYLGIAIGMTVVSAVSFMVSVFVLISGRQKEKHTPRRGEVRLTGSATFAMGDIKAAVRTGQWLRDPEWRKVTWVIFSALVLALGIFGIFLVIAPPGVKVIIVIIMIYMAAMVGRAVVRAR